MGFLSFLTGTKSTSDTTQDSTFDQSGTKTSDQTQTGVQGSTSTTTGSRTGTTDQSSTQQGTQQGTTSTTGTQTGTETGRQTAFGADALATLEGLFSGLAAGVDPTSILQQLQADASSAVGAFDPAAFINNAVSSAEQRFNRETDPTLKAFESAAGGSAGTNSMSALLQSQIAADKAGALAGVEANAASTANSIQQQNLAGLGNAGAQSLDALASIAGLLKGADVTTSAETTQVSEQEQLQNLVNTLLGTQTGTSSETSTQAIEQLLTQLMNVRGTEEQNVSGTQSATGSTTGTQTGSLLDAVGKIISFGE